jgi:hypothetical protein
MKRSLRAAIEVGEFIIAPGLHDMIAAVICNKVGFDFVYASGYWTTASAHGLPDAGIATYTQMECVEPNFNQQCRVWAKLRHRARSTRLPLSPQLQTFVRRAK